MLALFILIEAGALNAFLGSQSPRPSDRSLSTLLNFPLSYRVVREDSEFPLSTLLNFPLLSGKAVDFCIESIGSRVGGVLGSMVVETP